MIKIRYLAIIIYHVKYEISCDLFSDSYIKTNNDFSKTLILLTSFIEKVKS